MVKKFPTLQMLIIMLLLFLALSCAKQVTPSGGPKDVTPPKMVESTPAPGSTNFNQKTIQIKFDEFIKLNNINQKLIVSPPIEETPVVLLTGKGLKINLKPELLEPNTTYILNFNDAIADNNENNALNSFIYAFSTGDFIDSLSFSGYVLDAYTKKPAEDTWVILHSDLSDSAISVLPPSYITKTDNRGRFLIPYVKDNNYKIYALKDGNYNHKFDLPTESIAFIDSIFRPSVEMIPDYEIIKPDSILIDSSQIKNLETDSLENEKPAYKNIPENLELLLFTENKQSQFIKSHKRLTDNKLEIVFNSTQYEEFSVKVQDDENIVMYAKNNPDTVNIWLQNKELFPADSLKVFLDYRDPVYTDSIRHDTLRFRKPEKTDSDTVPKIKISTGTLPYKNFEINMNSPIDGYDISKLKVELLKDTVFAEIDFNLYKDSLNPLKLIIEATILESSDYRIIADSGFIENIKGKVNLIDTIKIKTSSEEEFGGLKINFGDHSKSYLVQLLQNNNTIKEQISGNGVVKFSYLVPGKYKIRVIEDLNNNKRWDTGDFLIKKQPEPVYYYPSEYEIMSKWEHEIDWTPAVDVSTGTEIYPEEQQEEQH
ncbi:MAG: Ig-like domain-containing protein [Bacteroidales bacterium]|jgi:hypothetical protein|nr:Ig-like domain-containing protein [Bacteroidales bacterium]